MAVDAQIEHFIGLSLAQELRTAPALSGVVLQVEGVQAAVPASTEEWMAFNVLRIGRRPSRRGTFWARILFQVACLSKLAPGRADRQTNAHLVLAAKVARALEQRDIQVKRYGVDDEAVGILKVREGQITPLPSKQDERTNAAVVTLEGHMIVTAA